MTSPPTGNFDEEPADEGSVSRVIRRMKTGDDEGADLLWARFYSRLTYLVRNRLRGQLRIVSDEEDVALESLAELFQGLLQGQYPALKDRESFWRLLVTVASRNVLDKFAHERRQKRGAGRVQQESDLAGDDSRPMLDRIASRMETPDMQVMIAERCTHLLEALDDDNLQAIALLKTSGATNDDVAKSLGMSVRSVERKLAEIRSRWSTG
ncbi:MAG: ECF-type sigma factor [Planctomycetaceae bacterium]